MNNDKYKIPNARPMTRKELKKFREAGLDPVFMDIKNADITVLKLQAQSNDWILDNIYAGHDFDEVPNPMLIELADQTFRLTYGLEKEVKNS